MITKNVHCIAMQMGSCYHKNKDYNSWYRRGGDSMRKFLPVFVFLLLFFCAFSAFTCKTNTSHNFPGRSRLQRPPVPSLNPASREAGNCCSIRRKRSLWQTLCTGWIWWNVIFPFRIGSTGLPITATKFALLARRLWFWWGTGLYPLTAFCIHPSRSCPSKRFWSTSGTNMPSIAETNRGFYRPYGAFPGKIA